MKLSSSERIKRLRRAYGAARSVSAWWRSRSSWSRRSNPVESLFVCFTAKDYSPLLRRMFCPGEEKIVPPDEIIRGYEIGPDKYIVITGQELESVSPERSRTIEIIEFIDVKDVDSIYYDHPYYLVPSRGGEKAYRLLVEVMQRTHKAGLAKFVLGEREYLVAVRSTEGALSLITLHYSEEILSDQDVAPEDGKIEPEEKNRMKKLIKEMTATSLRENMRTNAVRGS